MEPAAVYDVPAAGAFHARVLPRVHVRFLSCEPHAHRNEHALDSCDKQRTREKTRYIAASVLDLVGNLADIGYLHNNRIRSSRPLRIR